MQNTMYLIAFLLFLNCKAQKTPTHFSETAKQDVFLTLDNQEITFQDILNSYEGKTVLIDVWASWCSDCLKGMPKVKQLQNEYPEVTYLFLSLDKKVEAWKNGIKKYEVNGEHYYMQSGWKGDFGAFLDLDWIPRYLVIDKKGNIELFKAITADDEKIKQAIEKIN